MIPGFKARIIQEMKFLVDNFSEFSDLSTIKSNFKIGDNQFPSNCLTWVGASLVASLNTDIDRFLTTAEEFKENNDRMPDRFG